VEGIVRRPDVKKRQACSISTAWKKDCDKIEGVGRTKSSGEPVLQAFGIISYDDESATYRIRAFNDGRFLETQVKLLGEGNGMTWGFVLGDITTNSVLRINENGEWTELAEITIDPEPPKKLLELTVRPQK
jgi:hypothetical protein